MSTAAPLTAPLMALSIGDWFNLFLYYLSLSLLAVGGAIATAPDMHRFLVERQAWLTDPQFNASIAIAQAAPGPNVLFIALLGWNVGINAGGPGVMGWLLGALGMAVCMLGVMLPSSLLTWLATRWGHRNRERRGVRAFKQGMAPVVIGLLVATSWVLARAHGEWTTDWPLWLLTATATLLVWRTKLHLLWMLGAGAVLGALGMAVCMLGVMLPSSLLTWTATRWGHRNRERRGVRAFKQGMAPIVIGLVMATAWVLARAHGEWTTDWPLWLLTATATVLVWRTKLHLLWMLGAGAVLGALGWV